MEMPAYQEVLLGLIPIDKAQLTVCCNNKEVEVSKCSLLSACGFHAKLTGFRLKLGRRDISFEVILMPASAVRISKSGKFTYGCC